MYHIPVNRSFVIIYAFMIGEGRLAAFCLVCLETFYFSSEDQPYERARASASARASAHPHPHPLAFAVTILPRFLFSFLRSTIISENRRSLNRLFFVRKLAFFHNVVVLRKVLQRYNLNNFNPDY